MIAYRLVSDGVLNPGKCLCGSQTLPLLDTMHEIRGYGRVYLCPMCVLQAAHAHGYVAKDDYQRAIGDLAATVDRLEGELEQALAARVVSVDALLAEIQQRTQPQGGVTV